ncbi:hypothetical protein TNCV_3685091 [Trichonephila clavipes]|uniref:Uncharacterized protein n=1 Tax=Trichonephila clavipes TaxID=2585209 RepID=A0A8X6RUS3_TRICX|nr:hypothetical protein TNCV_3685091 [Trichonephila clavipes]
MASSFTGYPPSQFNFWLQGFLKDNLYRHRPAILTDLKDSVKHNVLDIPANLLRSAVKIMTIDESIPKSTSCHPMSHTVQVMAAEKYNPSYKLNFTMLYDVG